MNEEPPLSEDELKLVQAVKRTMLILAKAIRDKDIKEVVKDADLAEAIGDMTLEEALADEELGKKIRARVTPDMPQLNTEEEAHMICQLAFVVFARLLDSE